MRGIPNRGLVAGAMVVLAGLAAGCGSSYSSSPAPSTTGGVAGTTKQSSMPSARFATATVKGVGKVLVDARGRTVYVLTKPGQKNVPCTDANGCTKVWPDLPLAKGASAAKAAMGLEASLLGKMKLSDGETYPTYNGWLMYEYTGDTASGQANGEGIKSFGGTWYALSPSGKLVKPSSSSSSGGGGW